MTHTRVPFSTAAAHPAKRVEGQSKVSICEAQGRSSSHTSFVSLQNCPRRTHKDRQGDCTASTSPLTPSHWGLASVLCLALAHQTSKAPKAFLMFLKLMHFCLHTVNKTTPARIIVCTKSESLCVLYPARVCLCHSEIQSIDCDLVFNWRKHRLMTPPAICLKTKTKAAQS